MINVFPPFQNFWIRRWLQGVGAFGAKLEVVTAAQHRITLYIAMQEKRFKCLKNYVHKRSLV